MYRLITHIADEVVLHKRRFLVEIIVYVHHGDINLFVLRVTEILNIHNKIRS